MALDQKLSNQLDQISHADLRIDFDDNAMWSKLDGKLSNERRGVILWMVAAAILVLLLLFPFVLLRQSDPESGQALSDAVEVVKPIEKELAIADESMVVVDAAEKVSQKVAAKPVSPILILEKKRVRPELAAIQMAELDLQLQVVTTPSKEIKPLFAAEDISIIQASLERPSIREKGRTMTIRAHKQKSSTKSVVENQSLKIKLYETSNQE